MPTENEAALQLLEFKVKSLQDQNAYLKKQLESAIQQNSILMETFLKKTSTTKRKTRAKAS